MNRHPAGYMCADDDMTAYDCDADVLLDEPDARLRADPWEPWTCQRCGSETKSGMQETCPDCGMRNYG